MNNRLYNLPDELLTHIFEYDNPYRRHYKKVLFDLKWFFWWFQVAHLHHTDLYHEFHRWLFVVFKKIREGKNKRMAKIINKNI